MHDIHHFDALQYQNITGKLQLWFHMHNETSGYSSFHWIIYRYDVSWIHSSSVSIYARVLLLCRLLYCCIPHASCSSLLTAIIMNPKEILIAWCNCKLPYYPISPTMLSLHSFCYFCLLAIFNNATKHTLHWDRGGACTTLTLCKKLEEYICVYILVTTKPIRWDQFPQLCLPFKVMLC